MARLKPNARVLARDPLALTLAVGALLLGGALSARAMDAQATEPEPLDPFVVTIDIERSTVLLDRALEGAKLAPSTSSGDDRDDFSLRAAAASHEALSQLIVLRQRMCARGVVGAEHCGAFAIPSWAGEAVGAPVTLAELQARGEWIAETMAPFVDAGCAAGRVGAGDALFCSVE